MVSKTRDKFIEVARQLFARKGVDNTTMNDIAEASAKGRRTIYTYFKSKGDIFNAVVETETDQILSSLRIIVAQQIDPTEKLREFLRRRFAIVREVVYRNGSLKASFFRDSRKVDRVRKLIHRHEIVLLESILEEGVKKGCFNIPEEDINKIASVVIHTMHGLDATYIRASLNDKGIDQDTLADIFSNLLISGVQNRT